MIIFTSNKVVLGGIIFYLWYTVLQTQNGIWYSTVFDPAGKWTTK